MAAIVARIVAAAALCAALPGASLAQEFPARAITIVVPFPPAGVSDPVARLVAAKLAENVKQAVIVENKPGASGIIGAEFVKKAPADGYTLLLGYTGQMSVNPALYAKLPYDPARDFLPVTTLISTRNVLVVPAESPANSVAELVALARQNPKGLNFASQGVGTGGHLLGEMFKAKTGARLIHVPYKGSAPAIQDLLANRVDLYFEALVTALPHVQAGKLRALAITSSARTPFLPAVPTMAEAGFPGIESLSWFGMFVPAGTPSAVVMKLHEEFVKAVRDPAVQGRITGMGLDVMTTTPAELGAIIREESVTLGKVVRESGARVD